MLDLEAASGGAPVKRQRHWVLTGYLALTLLLNLAVVLFYALESQLVKNGIPAMPPWALPMLLIFGIINIISTVALFNWWKWGFWCLAVSAIVVLVINLSSGLGIGHSILGLLGPILMLGLLNIGTTNKAWPQMR